MAIVINGHTFQLDNQDFATAEIELSFDMNYSDGNVVIYDRTYDNSVNFATLITTEEQILNVNYDPENYNKFGSTDLELGSKFGSWEFGEDSFGNALTVVKTEKLSGKGHNIKLTFVDFSKSKWTLETLGTTYKMKKAR
jgi:hypothetical protein